MKKSEEQIKQAVEVFKRMFGNCDWFKSCVEGCECIVVGTKYIPQFFSHKYPRFDTGRFNIGVVEIQFNSEQPYQESGWSLPCWARGC